jgi:hypothetical protein
MGYSRFSICTGKKAKIDSFIYHIYKIKSSLTYFESTSQAFVFICARSTHTSLVASVQSGCAHFRHSWCRILSAPPVFSRKPDIFSEPSWFRKEVPCTRLTSRLAEKTVVPNLISYYSVGDSCLSSAYLSSVVRGTTKYLKPILLL